MTGYTVIVSLNLTRFGWVARSLSLSSYSSFCQASQPAPEPEPEPEPELEPEPEPDPVPDPVPEPEPAAAASAGGCASLCGASNSQIVNMRG